MLPNFIPIQFETMKPLTFFEEVNSTSREQQDE